MADSIRVEVAYALPQKQVVVPLTVPVGATVGQCIEQSKIVEQFADMDIRDGQVGIFGQPCKLSQVVKAGDRVEIYRPLTKDPMELRRERARQQAQKSPK